MAEEDDELEEQQPDPEPEERYDWPGAAPKQAAFLSAFVTTGGQVVWAARAAKIARSLHYRWLKECEAYRGLYSLAEQQAADILESEAIRRAKEGTREPIFYQGVKCGSVLRYPEGTMQFLLRGAKPEKYRERTEVMHTGEIELVERLKAARGRLKRSDS